MKVLFLGSSEFSKVVLERMIEGGVNVVCVITQPDRPAGRGHKFCPTPVKSFALEKGIEVKTFDKIRLHMEEVKTIDFDMSIVASFGQILPNEFLDYKLCLNVHPSLLPKYRGASPIQSAILNGDKKTGVTIMKVATEVDAGDIVCQEEVKIEEEYYLELEEKLARLGGDMILKAIDDYKVSKIHFTPQDHSQATIVGKFKKEDGFLDFSQSAEQIVNRVRALSEETGTYIKIDELVIKIEKVKDVSDEYNVEPFKILENKKHFVIGCQSGAVEILSCKAPSGKSVGGRDFLNGHADLLSKRVDNVK